MQNGWNEAEIAIALSLFTENAEYSEVLGRLHQIGSTKSYDALKGWYNRVKADKRKIDDYHALVVKFQKKSVDVEYPSDWAYSEMERIKASKKVYTEADQQPDKIFLVFACLHIPYHLGDTIKETIRATIARYPKCKINVIFAGDYFDVADGSTWDRSTWGPHLYEEYKEGFKFLIEIIDMINGMVLFLDGNHEHRVSRAMARNLPAAMSFLTTKSLTRVIANGILLDRHGQVLGVNEKVKARCVPPPIGDPTWCRIGDAVVCHSSRSSKDVSTWLRETARWFVNRRVDFSTMVSGHLHRGGDMYHSGKRCISVPCLYSFVKYDLSEGKFSYSEPSQVGYVTLAMKRNKVVDRHTGVTILATDSEKVQDLTDAFDA